MCLYCLCCTDVLTMRPPPNTSAFIFNYYDTHFSTMERRYPTIVLTHGLETKKIEASIIEKGVALSTDSAPYYWWANEIRGSAARARCSTRARNAHVRSLLGLCDMARGSLDPRSRPW